MLHSRADFISTEMSADLAKQSIDKVDVDCDRLKSLILKFGADALAASAVDLSRYRALELTEVWFNVLQPGGHHWDHIHAHHTLSGVIYLSEGCFTIFGDPRPAASAGSLNLKEGADGLARTYIHRGEANSIVVFPSWLPHRVATTPKLRKTIAFNLILRGEYGSPRSREQVVL
jgi:uncharacterized protein (TIGR02466 family)